MFKLLQLIVLDTRVKGQDEVIQNQTHIIASVSGQLQIQTHAITKISNK